MIIYIKISTENYCFRKCFEIELKKSSNIGKQRAEAVKVYMVGKGIDADRIITVDVKDKMPALKTEDGVQIERLSRTDILLIK